MRNMLEAWVQMVRDSKIVVIFGPPPLLNYEPNE